MCLDDGWNVAMFGATSLLFSLLKNDPSQQDPNRPGPALGGGHGPQRATPAMVVPDGEPSLAGWQKRMEAKLLSAESEVRLAREELESVRDQSTKEIDSLRAQVRRAREEEARRQETMRAILDEERRVRDEAFA
eukprot:4134166-Prymnesium_polylepis.2